jgi:glucokinase
MSNTIKNRVIGIDVGVTHTTLAVVDQRGNILGSDSFLTADYPDVNGFLEKLSERIVMTAEANGGFENIRSVFMKTFPKIWTKCQNCYKTNKKYCYFLRKVLI